MKLHNPVETNNLVVNSLAITISILAATSILIVWVDAIIAKQWWAIVPSFVVACVHVGWFVFKGR